ncbi:MAG: WYL domain-containing protein [bacterium]|nr:WYL domain-containing protein [bacterium]
MTRPNELSRLKRMLSAIHALEADRAYSFNELSELFGCDEAEVKRLLADLAGCCIDGRFLEFFYLDSRELPPDGGILTTGDFEELSVPKRLSRDESLALVCALDYLNDPVTSELRGKLAGSCLAKGSDPNSIKLFICSTSAMHVVGQLALLCEQRRYCTIEYAKPGEEPAFRTLQPLQLYFSESGVQYLYAYEDESESPKMFRVDRILGVEPLARHFKESGYPAPELLKLAESDSIVIQVQPGATFDEREWTGANELSPIGPIRRFEIPMVDDPAWIARKIASSFGSIAVEGNLPDSLARCIASFVHEALNDIERLQAEFS